MRIDAHIQVESKVFEHPRGGRAEAVASSLVDSCLHVETFFDLGFQRSDLLGFQWFTEIATKAVPPVQVFAERRIHPWVQMSADRTLARVEKFFERRVAVPLARDRIIDDIRRMDAVSPQQRMHDMDASHRAYARVRSQ